MNKKISLYTFLIFLFLFLVISCNYFVLKNHKEWLKSSGNLSDVDVYTSGWVAYVGAPLGRRGCYWKNNSDPILLDSCGVGTSIYIENNDVYVAGYDDSVQACYWKNGDKHLLPSSGISCSYDMIVKDGNIFNSGFNNAQREPCYWVNDKSYKLGTAGFSVFDLVDNVCMNVDYTESLKYDINLAGCFNTINTNTYVAMLWKRGGADVYVLTPTPLANVKTSRLVKYRDDLYIPGNDGSSPGYWKNTTFHPLSAVVAVSDYLYGIYVKNNKIYGVGTDMARTNAIYWEDNNVNTLPVGPGGKPSQAISILIYNDNIYIAGESDNQACYWVNGNRVDLPGTIESTAADIFVAPRD